MSTPGEPRFGRDRAEAEVATIGEALRRVEAWAEGRDLAEVEDALARELRSLGAQLRRVGKGLLGPRMHPSVPLAALALLATLVGGCTTNEGAAPGLTSGDGAASSIPSKTPRSSQQTAPVKTAELVSNWRQPGARWPTVLRLPYGPGRNDLGIDRFHDQEPIIPSAFALTPHGIAVLDPAKNRVVLLSRRGKLRREWLRIDQVASDMAYDRVHDQLVLISFESEHIVTALRFDGTRLDRRLALQPSIVVATDAGVSVLVSAGRQGLQPLPLDKDLRAGGAPASGLALADATVRVTPQNQAGRTYLARSSIGWATRFRLRASSPPRAVSTTFVHNVTASRGHLLFGMLVGSFQLSRGRRPLYLLDVDATDGSAVSFTQVALCSLKQMSNQYTYITTDANGAVYQLCLGREGVEIRRRPANMR